MSILEKNGYLPYAESSILDLYRLCIFDHNLIEIEYIDHNKYTQDLQFHGRVRKPSEISPLATYQRKLVQQSIDNETFICKQLYLGMKIKPFVNGPQRVWFYLDSAFYQTENGRYPVDVVIIAGSLIIVPKQFLAVYHFRIHDLNNRFLPPVAALPDSHHIYSVGNTVEVKGKRYRISKVVIYEREEYFRYEMMSENGLETDDQLFMNCWYQRPAINVVLEFAENLEKPSFSTVLPVIPGTDENYLWIDNRYYESLRVNLIPEPGLPVVLLGLAHADFSGIPD